MSNPGDYAEYGIPAFGAGDVLSVSARVIGARFGQLAALSLVCTLPVLALQIASAFVENIAQTVATQGLPALVPLVASAVGLGFLQLLLGMIAQGAIVYTTVEYLAGQHVSVAQALRMTIQRLLVIIGTALLATLLQGLGFVLCIVPGVILMCMYYVAVPAAVAERLGPTQALGRSAALTAGYRVQIFVLVLVLLAISIALGIAVSMITLPFGEERVGRLIGAVFQSLMTVLQTLLTAVFAAVAYARLRGIREGIDAYSLAQVFD